MVARVVAHYMYEATNVYTCMVRSVCVTAHSMDNLSFWEKNLFRRVLLTMIVYTSTSIHGLAVTESKQYFPSNKHCHHNYVQLDQLHTTNIVHMTIIFIAHIDTRLLYSSRPHSASIH